MTLTFKMKRKNCTSKVIGAVEKSQECMIIIIVQDSNKNSSSRQQAYFLYCFKMFASEKMPNKKLSKGFLERLIPLKSVPGDPEFDISEVVDDSRDEQFKELYEELIHTRKLLLMYRLLHHNDLFQMSN